MMKIKIFVMDVDGTLTDGSIYIGTQGETMKVFNAKDGYAIANLLPKKGIEPIIITGRKSQIVAKRAEELKIKKLYQGIQNKQGLLEKIMKECHVQSSEIAYIGDDLNDIDCIRFCGLSACPQDAVEEVKLIADYVCKNCGGKGAVREFIEYITDENMNY